MDWTTIVGGIVATVLTSFFKQTGWRKEVNAIIAVLVAIGVGVLRVYWQAGTLVGWETSVALVFATATVIYGLIWRNIERATGLAEATSIWTE